MSNIDFYPRNSYWLVANGSTLELGSYEIAEDGDLSLVHFRVYNKVTGPYDFDVRLVLSSKRSGPVLQASEWYEFSNATTGQVANNYLVDMSFDMAGYNLLAGETYFLRLEFSGYSRFARPNENTSYFAVWVDWMQPVGITNTAGARLALGVKR